MARLQRGERGEAFIFILRGQREERGGVNLLVPRILVTKTDILQCIALGMRRIQVNVFLMTWSVYKVQLLSASCQCDLDDDAECRRDKDNLQTCLPHEPQKMPGPGADTGDKRDK